MAETAEQRLDLLQAAGKLGPRARAAAGHLVGALREWLGQDLNDSHGIMMVTHLALACQRALDGEPPAPPPPEAEAELAAYGRERAAAARLLQEVEPMLEASMPPAEVTYLAMHLAARAESGGGAGPG